MPRASLNMRPFIRCLAGLCLLLFSFTGASQTKPSWSFKTYAVIEKNSIPLFRLEYGMRDKYDGWVTWRLSNLSTITVYDVSIAAGNIPWRMAGG